MSRFGVLSRLAAGLLVTFAFGCDSSSGLKDAPPTPAAGTRVLDAALATAAINGRVRYDGDAPDPAGLRMSADPYCVKANAAQPAVVRDIEVGADGGLAGVVVHVSKGLEAYRFSAPAEPLVLDQSRCMYAPRVFAIEAGRPLEIRNSDDTLHNVHAVARGGDGFNVGMPKRGMTTLKKFMSPKVFVRMKCDVHPWMTAYVAVVTNPFHAVTGADGHFSLTGLPQGSYTIEASHPVLGSRTARVQVAERGVATADFAFSD